MVGMYQALIDSPTHMHTAYAGEHNASINKIIIWEQHRTRPGHNGTSLHLTELTDDVSLCSYLVERTYLSAFYKTVIIVMIKKQ